MPAYTLALTLAASAAASVAAQSASYTYTSGVPLASKTFAYPDGIPYQADPDNGVRGTQPGYNLCNSTTEGDKSMCQTAFINALDDFCLWAPPGPQPDTIGDTEHEEVAWCTKPGRGTRVIPEGALQGVQFMKTPDYLQVVGFIDQTKIMIPSDDGGGELDPHGADFRGNPLGGLVYSNGWSNGKNDSFQQVIEWHNFMGGNQFCFKICDPAGKNAADFCQHIYDRIGCAYNAPNAAQNGSFTSCEGDNQDFPGVYTDASGATQTYTQPPESLGAIQSLPYTPRVPSSSNCQTFSSAALFAAATTSASGTSASQTGTTKKGSATGSGASATATGDASGARGLVASALFAVFATMAGVVVVL